MNTKISIQRNCLYLLLLLSISSSAKAQTDAAKKYLLSALDLMKSRSINKNKLDWNSIYKTSLEELKNARTIEDTYPIIRTAQSKLEDSHSNFFPPEAVASLLLGYKQTGLAFPYAKYKLIDGKYGYLSVPGIGCYNFKDWDEYASHILKGIKELDNNELRGWIIDLRENDGGMLQPMYAGLHPFFEMLQLVGSRDADGIDGYYGFKNHSVYYRGEKQHTFNIPTVKLRNRDKTIIVLTSRTTASSGEFITIAFSSLPNVKLLGDRTNGLTSDNTEHRLSDGAFLVLTEGTIINSKKELFDEVGKGIQPDILILDTQNQEKIIEAAKNEIDHISEKK